MMEKAVYGIRVFGGLALNDPVGGINPEAVRTAIDVKARVIWMPTISARNHLQRMRTTSAADHMGKLGGVSGEGIYILDGSGEVVPEVVGIVTLLKEADIILATGHLSLKEIKSLASLLASILMFSAALSQPIFGILSDRIGGKMLMLWGAMMAAAGISFIGLLPSYTLLFLFLVFSGLWVTCFHPQAAALAGHFSGPRKGLGISLFMLGGNVGYGLGPMFILAIVLGLSLKRSYVALLPAATFVLLLVRYLPKSVLPMPAT